MTETELKTREQELLEEFKDGLDPNAAPQLAERIAALEADRDAAIARAEKAERATASAKAKISRVDAPAKARNLKPMDDSLTGDALSEALNDAISTDKPVEIAFSDGKREITEIPPVRVEGMAWRDHSLGKMLRDPVDIEGAGNTSIGVHGYALLISGKQVAYQTRSDQLNIAPGQKVTLRDDIVF